MNSVTEPSSVEPGPIAVDLRDIGFTYPTGTVALEGLSLRIPVGRVIGIVGPSGCGKSTMLSLVSRLAEPTSGDLQFNLERTAERHDTTMVFQQDTLLPWLTLAENVGLYFRFHRPKDKKALRREINDLLAMVGLEQFAKSYPSQLSGGMRRRGVFLAAVAPRPQLLLLDEPFSSVDEPTRLGIHQQALRIVRQFGVTVILVTHDLAEAISLSDQVAIFSARPGRIVSIHNVPFGEERDILALRDEPQFLELYARLWRELSAEIAQSQRQHDDL